MAPAQGLSQVFRLFFVIAPPRDNPKEKEKKKQSKDECLIVWRIVAQKDPCRVCMHLET